MMEKRFAWIKKITVICLLFTLLLPLGARADEPEPEGRELVLTIGGDCTLGSEEKYWKEHSSFIQHIERYGKAYPFMKLQSFFAGDDLTIVNLEGVFYDQQTPKIKKTYNFRAPTHYADILPLGSVEAVCLGNNHTIDYGQPGFDATVQALDERNIPWFVESHEGSRNFIFEKYGVKVGFVSFYVGYYKSSRAAIRKSFQDLRKKGCQAIIGIMHGGEEYSLKHSGFQREMAQLCIEEGACIVVGHHPHVLQGMDLLPHHSVIYSLGNLAFGGNKRVKLDADLGLVLRVHLRYDDAGGYLGHQITLYPIHPSGTGDRINNFQPILAEGDEARRAMNTIQLDTKHVKLPPYVEGRGVKLPFVPYLPFEESGK